MDSGFIYVLIVITKNQNTGKYKNKKLISRCLFSALMINSLPLEEIEIKIFRQHLINDQ